MREQRERNQNKMNRNKDEKPADQKRNKSLDRFTMKIETNIQVLYDSKHNHTRHFACKSCSTESPAVNK